jgi:protein gp37
MNPTKIEWADMTWNPVTGCRHGCPYCYARKIAQRFGKMLPDFSVYPKEHDGCHMLDNEIDNNPFPWLFEPTFHAARLNEPEREKKPKNIFVVSMGDLFGDWVPKEWIMEVFAACERAPWHRYLFLTKNYLRASKFKFRDNWWIGKTVTCKENSRLFEGDPWSTDITKRANQFLSIEPIHGPIPDLPYYAHKYGFKWVIVGAETGPKAKQNQPRREWIEKIVADCAFRKVPILMKGSLAKVWGTPLLQEFPWEEKK